MEKMEEQCKDLLREWCQTMLDLQVRGTGNPRLDGAILCPSCGRIHGRCFEAMLPFLHMAATGEDGRSKVWIRAAEQLFDWAEEVVSQPDGSYINDVESDWKGTTVFSAIQLADCLLQYGDLISEQTNQKWKQRLKQAAEFLYTFEEINQNNINYPISNALALYECGLVFEDSRFMDQARQLASMANEVLTEQDLLFGEGVPRFQKSPRGCYPVDIGYNVEETLPSLALYGLMSENKEALEIAERGLLAQLDFMLEDGAWDNSFGTRNFKWTYWGSRTSDGCALGYLLFAHKHPAFALAADKNLKLLRACTYDGLLAGGPHYQAAGQPGCVHHTITHAKVLAGILDRKLCVDAEAGIKLPRQNADGIRHFPEIDTWLVNASAMTATVTAYDWEYLPGGHVSGGTLSLLHHNQAGALLCAGMGEYTLKEPNNMQIPVGVRHECLALRMEKQMGDTLYSSIYETDAEVRVDGQTITVSGCLKDRNHHTPSDQELRYAFYYEWKQDSLSVKAVCDDGILICPFISRGDEAIEIQDGKNAITLQKETCTVSLESKGKLMLPYQTERIFNLVPGFQALRVELDCRGDGAEFAITVQSGPAGADT